MRIFTKYGVYSAGKLQGLQPQLAKVSMGAQHFDDISPEKPVSQVVQDSWLAEILRESCTSWNPIDLHVFTTLSTIVVVEMCNFFALFYPIALLWNYKVTWMHAQAVTLKVHKIRNYFTHLPTFCTLHWNCLDTPCAHACITSKILLVCTSCITSKVLLVRTSCITSEVLLVRTSCVTSKVLLVRTSCIASLGIVYCIRAVCLATPCAQVAH